MRVAVIDCGTNTFNLLIADIGERGFKKVFSSKIPVKLGEHGINRSLISEIPFQRGIQALKKYKDYLIYYHVNETVAIATSAIRDAQNGSSFIQKAFEETGIKIEIIDGMREAELIYKGNHMAAKPIEGKALIMDIGGGSNEYILCGDGGLLWKKSYRHGASRLLQKFKLSNPLLNEEKFRVFNFLEEELKDLLEVVNPHLPVKLIGSSGAFDSVVEMIHANLGGEKFTEDKLCYIVKREDYDKISSMIKSSTYEQRLQMPGLVEMRADMMVISCLLMDFIIEKLSLQEFQVSVYSLKEGVLAELIEKNKNQFS